MCCYLNVHFQGQRVKSILNSGQAIALIDRRTHLFISHSWITVLTGTGMYSDGSPITYTSSKFIFSFVTFHVSAVKARQQSRFENYYRRIRIETEENNGTPALYLWQVSVVELHPTQCSQFWNQIQSTYNRSKTRYRATALILSLLLASSRIDSKFIKQKWHVIQAWL